MIQFDEHIFPMGWNHQLDDFVDFEMRSSSMCQPCEPKKSMDLSSDLFGSTIFLDW